MAYNRGTSGGPLVGAVVKSSAKKVFGTQIFSQKILNQFIKELTKNLMHTQQIRPMVKKGGR